jgi:hypothetical protein
MKPPNPDTEARLHLVKANRAAIYVMVCRAVGGGLSVGDAVVIVADTSDPVGLELADAAAVKAGLYVHNEASRVQEHGEIPTAIIAVPLEAAKSIFSESHPSIASGLVRPVPTGCVRVVSIAAGAAMLVHTDVRPTAPIADA